MSHQVKPQPAGKPADIPAARIPASGDEVVVSIRERIVAAGCEEFLEVGFALNVKDVALRARVSRQSVYRHFEDRPALLRVILNRLQPDITPRRLPKTANTDLRKVLTAFCEHYLEDSLSEQSLAVYRVMMGPRPAGEDATFIYDEIYNAALKELTEFIFRNFGAQLGGRARSDRLAERFLGSVMGYRRFRKIFGVHEPADHRHLAIAEAISALLLELRQVEG